MTRDEANAEVEQERARLAAMPDPLLTDAALEALEQQLRSQCPRLRGADGGQYLCLEGERRPGFAGYCVSCVARFTIRALRQRLTGVKGERDKWKRRARLFRQARIDETARHMRGILMGALRQHEKDEVLDRVTALEAQLAEVTQRDRAVAEDLRSLAKLREPGWIAVLSAAERLEASSPEETKP